MTRDTNGGGRRFSNRLAWEAGDNALSCAAARHRAAGLPLFDLTGSNPTIVGFRFPPLPAAIGRVAAYRPAPRGLERARRAVSRYYAESHGVGVDPADIALTCSTSEAYAQVFRLLCDAGDEILVPRPSYPLFDFLAAVESVRAIPYTLYWDGDAWCVDMASMAAAFGARTRAVLTVNPNNPTGNVLTAAERAALTAFCAERQAPLIVDEVFLDYPRPAASSELVTCAAGGDAPVLVLSGLSKVSALPQLKLSWIVAAGPDTWRRRAMHGLELLGDTFLSVAQSAQEAVGELLDIRRQVQPQIRRRCRRNLSALHAALAGTGAEVREPEAGWYAVVRMPPPLDDEAWALRLIEAGGTLVHPGYLFDFREDDLLVVSLLPRDSIFARGLDVWRRAL